MKKKRISLLLAALLTLTLCACHGGTPEPEQTAAAVTETTQETLPPPTVPADGNPGDVTCKGSYTAADASSAVVATAGEARLTARQLQAWYWAAVAQYRQEGHPENPDYSQSLDTQVCGIDSSVNSWQQYFLRQALSCWQDAQALALHAQVTEVPTEEAYQPNLDTHERCMTGKPATAFLYGYDKTYEINTMHKAYLENLPQTLTQLAADTGFADTEAMARESFGCSAQELTDFVREYNYAYMYLTFLSYSLRPQEQQIQEWFTEHQQEYQAMGITQETEGYVDIRHILLQPEGDWAACEEKANSLLKKWVQKTRETEATFADMAYRNSQDALSAANGGSYRRLTREQLPQELTQWCFDPARVPGETTIVRTEQGFHILFYVSGSPAWYVRAEQDLTAHMLQQQIRDARQALPMEVDYSAICLTEAAGAVSLTDVLYPDIAHERYPEVPLYLQQDYPRTWFGNYKISSHGCGITTFSMLSTYMSDEEWTPPEMCALYGGYSHENGTDGMIFINEAPKYNYYFIEKTYDPNVAKQALQDGHIVVSIQHKGYWTSGGHYILFEKWTEDGMVQVRDSNIANYGKLPQHKEDKHTWFNATYAGSGYWIFDKKITRYAACGRCGLPEDKSAALLQSEYLCEKCEAALLRRNTWLDSRNG